MMYIENNIYIPSPKLYSIYIGVTYDKTHYLT